MVLSYGDFVNLPRNINKIRRHTPTLENLTLIVLLRQKDSFFIEGTKNLTSRS